MPQHAISFMLGPCILTLTRILVGPEDSNIKFSWGFREKKLDHESID